MKCVNCGSPHLLIPTTIQGKTEPMCVPCRGKFYSGGITAKTPPFNPHFEPVEQFADDTPEDKEAETE